MKVRSVLRESNHSLVNVYIVFLWVFIHLILGLYHIKVVIRKCFNVWEIQSSIATWIWVTALSVRPGVRGLVVTGSASRTNTSLVSINIQTSTRLVGISILTLSTYVSLYLHFTLLHHVTNEIPLTNYKIKIKPFSFLNIF